MFRSQLWVFADVLKPILTKKAERNPMRSGSFTTNLGVIRYWVTDAPLAGKPWLVLLPGLTADHRLFARQIK